MSKFKILSCVILVMVLVSVGLYDFFDVTVSDNRARLTIKILPLSFLLLLNISYFFIYRLTIYSFMNLISLICCLIGDLFMGLYDPSVLDIANNRVVYLILGGSLFFMARILWTFIFMIYPYKNIKFIQYPYHYLFLSHIISTAVFGFIGLLFVLYDSSLISFLIFAYITLAFGLPFSYAFLRIFVDTGESNIPKYLSFFGIFLFNISDILLLATLQTNIFPPYVILISDNIYWMAMYLLTLSILRSSDYNIEKGVIHI